MKKGPWRITFDTNPDQCNFKCIMCECFSPYSKVLDERRKLGISKRKMDIKLIKKVLEESIDSPLREIIPSTMGEPLLYENFEEIIELCKEYRIKLNLTTNGSFPIKEAEYWAKILVPITSDIKISWNGSTKETQEQIMIGSNWEKAIHNLKTYIGIRDEHHKNGGNRCRVTIQLTFLESNFRELKEIAELAIFYGVDRIKGHHLWTHFDEIKNSSMKRNYDSILSWNEAVRETKEYARNNKLSNGNFLLLENIEELSMNDIKSSRGNCPFLENEAWVNTEGLFSPCCAPSEVRKTLGNFGNLYESSMEDIWTSKGYKNLCSSYKNHELCKTCNMRR